MAKNPPKNHLPAHMQGTGQNSAAAGRTVVTQQQAFISEHVGPLPAPDTLAEYDQTLPGLAERIVQMAETEQRTRVLGLEGEIKNRRFEVRFGRISAFLYSLAVCGVAMVAIYAQYPYAGTIIIGLHVAAVCAQLISIRRQG
jgi:uncharacterized membrane protein